MKNLVGRTFTSLLLGVLAFGPVAQAQFIERVIKAHIPVSATPAVLQLRDAEDRLLPVTMTNSVEALSAPQTPKLRFYGEGGRYVLTEVWQADDSFGQQLHLPKTLTTAARRKSVHIQIVAADNSR